MMKALNNSACGLLMLTVLACSPKTENKSTPLTPGKKGKVTDPTPGKTDTLATPSPKANLPEGAGSAALRKTTIMNLSQIALAMHNHAGTYEEAFPAAASYSKDGKPLLSWRVGLLPFLDQSALYRKFKLDEPWDSPNNIKLVESMPAVYDAAPSEKKAPKGHTFYRVFIGPDAAFTPGPGTQAGNLYPKGRKAGSFLDSLGETLLVVEAGDAVIWSKPDELGYDAKKPLPKLGGVSSDGFYAAMGDGTIKFFRPTISESSLRGLITPAGGEVIDWKTIPWEAIESGVQKPKGSPPPPK